MSSQEAPAVVIGAGVVGCALAQALAKGGRAPIVLEREARVAEGTTSRNSGVVHGGLYYRPGSLKATTCVRGRRLLYEWCDAHDVPHRRCGKWIVGPRTQADELETLLSNARACGVEELGFQDVRELRQQAPFVRGEVALLSRETGIVDPVALTQSYRAAAEDDGATFVTSAPVLGLDLHGDRWRLETARGSIESPLVFNAAGLHADEIAALAGVERYRLHPCRGDYFRLPSPWRIPALVYPVRARHAPGLGVHLTLDLAGNVRLGPDTRWIDRRDDYAPPSDEEALRDRFADAAAKILVGLRAEDLSWDSCGIRPKLRAPDETEDHDFVVSMDRPGLVNLVGIESPGLTAALALAETALALVR